MAARGYRWQEGIDDKQDIWEHFGVMQMFYVLTMVVFTILYAGFSKIHRTVYLIRKKFTEYKSCLRGSLGLADAN